MQEIQAALGITVTPVHCLTSQVIGETPPDFAHDFDSITNEPMGISFQLWLETEKPIQLRPDSCSWITYIRFEDVLKDQVVGRRDEQLEKHRNAIRKYLQALIRSSPTGQTTRFEHLRPRDKERGCGVPIQAGMG